MLNLARRLLYRFEGSAREFGLRILLNGRNGIVLICRSVILSSNLVGWQLGSNHF